MANESALFEDDFTVDLDDFASEPDAEDEEAALDLEEEGVPIPDEDTLPRERRASITKIGASFFTTTAVQGDSGDEEPIPDDDESPTPPSSPGSDRRSRVGANVDGEAGTSSQPTPASSRRSGPSRRAWIRHPCRNCPMATRPRSGSGVSVLITSRVPHITCAATASDQVPSKCRSAPS